MPPDAENFQARITNGLNEIAEAEWNLCYPEEAESWRYYRACEAGAAPGVTVAAVELRDDKGLAAATPLFQLSYRLDTPLQGGLRRVAEAVSQCLPSLTEWRMLGVGSPYADRCHIAIRPDLSAAEQTAAIKALIAAVEREAEHRKAVLIVYKDLAGAELAAIEGALAQARYACIRSLPVASLDLPGPDIEAYIAMLSPATRKDVRRKLKAAGAVRIERRSRIDDVDDAIDELYEETRRNSGVHYGDFEELPAGYFRSVAKFVGEGAQFSLYWIGGQLAAFNLLLLGRDVVIDKFLGMRYPLAREHNLYVVSWIENVRLCLETGRRRLQSGQTAYGAKLRLGSNLQPSMIFARHRNPIINRLVQLAAPIAAFDRWDPDLRQLAARRKAA